jgi:hypothetical protein
MGDPLLVFMASLRDAREKIHLSVDCEPARAKTAPEGAT